MKLRTNLFDYQKKAVKKLSKIKVGALYMDMGTGKTRTALELIELRMSKGKVTHVLWFCPCSVKTNLKRDIMKHTDNMLDKITIMGIESISMSDRTYLQALDIVAKNKTYLVVDESNLVKNWHAKRTQRMIEISTLTEYKLILNGTPVTRNEADLYSQWYILDSRIFGYRTYWSFAANHLEYDDYGRVRRVLNVDYLTNKIAPYSYQIKKSETGIELPDKNYYNYYFSLTYDQFCHYEDVKHDLLADVDEFEPWTIYRLLTALQLIASGRRLSAWENHLEHEPFFGDPRDNPRIQALTNNIQDTDEKHIIWTKYSFEIEEIKAVLRDMDLNVALFYGDIPLMERDRELENFMEDAQFLLANKSCGGYGLNLQFCNNMIYYSNDFDWGTRIQSEDRVHRIGQDNPVFITDIIADNKIDEMIMKNLSKKENLDSQIAYLLKNKKDLEILLEGSDANDKNRIWA